MNKISLLIFLSFLVGEPRQGARNRGKRPAHAGTPLDEMDAGNCIEAFSSEEYILERSNDYSDIVVEYGVVDKLSVVPRNSKLVGRRRFLCCFLHRHLCFRLAEVQSVAEQIYGA